MSTSDPHTNHSTSWHTLPPELTAARLNTDLENGLPHEEASSRFIMYGPNRVIAQVDEPWFHMVLEALKEPLIVLLLLVAFLYLVFGELSEALVVLGIIVVMFVIELLNDRRANRAVAALQDLNEPAAVVRRDGQRKVIPADGVVPGDLLLLEAGRRIPADARIVQAISLLVDESTLTGESWPVEKNTDANLQVDTPLAERQTMVYAGTFVTHGQGGALVTETGKNTEFGVVAELTKTSRPPLTPLQTNMRELTRWLVWFAVGISILVPILAWWRSGMDMQEGLLTGLSLAFATIPEEGPILISMMLALGAYRLARQKAIVKEQKAVETLGGVTVILSDKTGTLTVNQHNLDRIIPAAWKRRLLEIAVMATEVDFNRANGDLSTVVKLLPELRGMDPIDTVILKAALEAGLDVRELRSNRPIDAVLTFDNTRRRMSMVYRRGAYRWVSMKGAPEAVLEVCTHRWTSDGVDTITPFDRESIQETIRTLANTGARVIAIAERALDTHESRGPLDEKNIEQNMNFAGLISLSDPLRPESYAAIRTCQSAGIKILLVTGDHQRTAASIALQLGMAKDVRPITGVDLSRMDDQSLELALDHQVVFARTTPTDKLRLVKVLQARGERVAVTGDGINDAPALATADIGVAMGLSGTDIARSAADIVLADDNFNTLVRAIAEGRLVFANLSKAFGYYLGCKLGLVSVVMFPIIIAFPIPFTPIQIILTELFMDLAASVAFLAEPAERNLMDQPPRNPRIPFMDREMLVRILRAAAGLFVPVLLAYFVGYLVTQDQTIARTLAFVTWMLAHVLVAFSLRSEQRLILRMNPLQNRVMLTWGIVVILFVLLITYVQGISSLVNTTRITGFQWLLCLLSAIFGVALAEVPKVIHIVQPKS